MEACPLNRLNFKTVYMYKKKLSTIFANIGIISLIIALIIYRFANNWSNIGHLLLIICGIYGFISIFLDFKYDKEEKGMKNEFKFNINEKVIRLASPYCPGKVMENDVVGIVVNKATDEKGCKIYLLKTTYGDVWYKESELRKGLEWEDENEDEKYRPPKIIYSHGNNIGYLTVYRGTKEKNQWVDTSIYWKGEIKLNIKPTKEELTNEGLSTNPNDKFEIDKFFPYHHGDAHITSIFGEYPAIITFKGLGELTYYTKKDIYITLTENDIVLKCLQEVKNKQLTFEQGLIKAILLLVKQNNELAESIKRLAGSVPTLLELNKKYS